MSKEYRATTVKVIHIPKGIDDIKTRFELVHRYGIEIAGGIGNLKGNVWRIGLMGHSARRDHVDRLINSLKDLL